MDGVASVRSVLVADGSVTSLVPTTRIIADDVLPQGTVIPAILIRLISGTDRNIPNQPSTIHVRQRVQVEIHAATNPSRQAIKRAVREAVRANRFPTVSGLTFVTIHTEAEGPNFYNEDPFVRVGVQDFQVTYSEAT